MGIWSRLADLDRRAFQRYDTWARSPQRAARDAVAEEHEGRAEPVTWRRRSRRSVWDLSKDAGALVIVAGFAIWGAIAYLAAAIGGSADPAGNNNRWSSALFGLGCLAVAVPLSTFIVLWLMRPARPSELWPWLNKRSSSRDDE